MKLVTSYMNTINKLGKTKLIKYIPRSAFNSTLSRISNEQPDLVLK